MRAAELGARVQIITALVECAAVGSLAGGIVFAAGIASDAPLARSLIAVAAGMGALTAVMFWCERPPRARRLVNRADRRAGLDGALVAALDTTRNTTRNARVSRVSELLAERVRTRVGPRELVASALPRTPLAVVAPLLALVLIAGVEELRPPPTAGAAGGALASAAADLRRAAQSRRAQGDAAAADALEIAARGVTALAADPDRAAAAERALESSSPGSRGGPETAAARDLERLAAADLGDASLREALERARAILDADPNRTAGLSPDSGQEPVASGAGGESGTGASAGGNSHPGDGSADGALANGPSDGRMLGPQGPGESRPRSSDPLDGTLATGGPGRGVVSARWWPSRYDAVVERYLTP